MCFDYNFLLQDFSGGPIVRLSALAQRYKFSDFICFSFKGNLEVTKPKKIRDLDEKT